jgi:ABC-2 type transport system permease protein
LQKELLHGSKSFFFVIAILAPLTISLVLSLVFGTLFSDKPKLGIADEGDSQLVKLAAAGGSVVTKAFASNSALRDAVRSGAVDMGIVLPRDFDRSISQGEETEISALVWGESLAKNRVILGATISDLMIQLSGREAPVEIVTTALGDSESIPWSDRLLPLVVLLTVVMGGSMIPASSLVDERQKRTLTALTTTPVTLEEVFATKALMGVGVSLLMGLVILTINQAFGARPGLLVLVLALGATLAAAFGLLLGTLVKDITALFATFKSIGIFLYAPAFLYFFPDVPEWIGKVFPTYYMVQPVVEISQRGAAWPDVAFEVIVLAGEIVVLLGVVALVARRAKARDAFA